MNLNQNTWSPVPYHIINPLQASVSS